MSHETLIADLSADLAPVRRRSALREGALLLALGAAELALLLAMGLMRPDMPQVIGSGFMLWKLGCLAALAAVSALVALRSFSPTRSPRRGLAFVLALAGAAMIAGLFVSPGRDGAMALLDRLAPIHGLFCAAAIVVLSLPMMALLAHLMQRGAPVHPQPSAMATGLAAGTCGALIFAVCCPMNDPLYVIVWYFFGCAMVTGTARWLLPRRFRL